MMLIPYIFDYFWVGFPYLAIAPYLIQHHHLLWVNLPLVAQGYAKVAQC
jgi:hypothetical protein